MSTILMRNFAAVVALLALIPCTAATSTDPDHERALQRLDQAKAAVTEGADYISVGPMFETATKDAGPPIALEVLKQVLAEIQLPVVAVGGINAGNVSQLTDIGAKCVAVCSAVISADDPKAAGEAIKKLLP